MTIFIRGMCPMVCAVALAACTASPDNFDTAYNSHASRYSDARTTVIRDYQAGKLSDAEMRARLRAAGEELTAADAATGRDAQRALSQNTQAPAATSPASESDNQCFLISCKPVAQANSAPARAPAQQASTKPTAGTASPTPAQAQPKDEPNSCLLISCN